MATVTAALPRPVALRVNPDNVPPEMQAERRWVVWRYEWRQDRRGEWKWTKPPYQAGRPRFRASSTAAKTWGTYAQAFAAYRHGDADGIGFVLGDGWAGVDLDHVLTPDGALELWVAEEVAALQTYTERSPSGMGIRAVLRATLPSGARKRLANIEVYDRERFLTITGHHLADTPLTVEPRQPELDAFRARRLPTPEPVARPTGSTSRAPVEPLDLDDESLIAKACAARNGSGARFAAWWQGELAGKHSPSEAVAALLKRLAFWTQKDPERMDRLFRRSGLMYDKWDGRRGDTTWGAREIARAISLTTDVYTPQRRVSQPGSAGPHAEEADMTDTAGTETGAASTAQQEDERREADTLAQLIATLTAGEDVGVVFDAVDQLATLGPAEYGRAKAALKAHFGKALNLNDLDKAVNEARRAQAHAAVDDDSGLPPITVNNRPLRDVTTEATRHLTEANDPPLLFVRSGALVRTRADEEGRPIIDGVSGAILRWRLARIANFVRETEQGPIHVPPPQDVVTDVLALPTWAFPGLVGITEVPVLRPDGTLVTEPGYDRATRLIYRPALGLTIPDVPTEPTTEDIQRALGLIWEAIGEFPFVDEASQANTLALLLTPVLRAAIPGQVPLGLIDAPKAGTGKGLLADVISYVATGRTAAIMTAPREEDEWRKRITSVLATGATVIGIDNVVDRLASPSLAAVLTASVWQDRLLGQSTMLTLPQRATWMATGNNIRLGGDIPRRCYWIRLDAKMAKPWQRCGFTHPDLLVWAEHRRGESLAALLTLARAWFANWKPAADKTPIMGSFQTWASTLAGVLAHAGVPAFLGNLEQLYESADDETPQWEAFLTAWHTLYGEEAKTTAEVVADLSSESPDERRTELRETLPDTLATALTSKVGNLSVKLGKALSSQVDVRYGDLNLRLTKAGTEEARTHRGAVRWRVEADPLPSPEDHRAEDAEDAEDAEVIPPHGADANTPLDEGKWGQERAVVHPSAANGHARGVSVGGGSAGLTSASSASSAAHHPPVSGRRHPGSSVSADATEGPVRADVDWEGI